MTRLLISVGCDVYDYPGLDRLKCAERDAERFFQLLCDPEIGAFCGTRSILLRSPSKSELDQSLARCVSQFRASPPEIVVFFFAGHGVLSKDSFRLLVRDSDPASLTMTSLGFSELVRAVEEMSPAHLEFVVDACQSGGMGADLGSLMSLSRVGSYGASGITVLAACASNESAYELNGAGVLTDRLLALVSGSAVVQSHDPTLSLLELGRACVDPLQILGGQSPVVWGLNIASPSWLCRNPHFAGDLSLGRQVSVLPREFLQLEQIAAFRALYLDFDSRSSAPADLYAAARKVIGDVVRAGAFDAAISVAIALRQSFLERSERHPDPFYRIKTWSACLCALAPFYSASPAISDFLDSELLSLVSESKSQLCAFSEAWGGDAEGLVAGGLAELFYLPQRITSILGWIGFCLAADSFDRAGALVSLARQLVGACSLSIQAVSDCQASHVWLAVNGLSDLDPSLVEEFLGLMFLSACDCRARFAVVGVPPERIPDYLVMRALRRLDDAEDYTANPSELLAALLIAAERCGLSDAVDLDMRLFDRRTVCVFLPQTYDDFAEERILRGHNLCAKLGFDFWRAGELVDLVEDALNRAVPISKGQWLVCALSSLFFEDRVPWKSWRESGIRG